MFIVHVAGHLGKEPETRFTANGQKVTTFSLAVNQRKGKEEVTVWVRVAIWGDRFDKMVSFLKKGSGVIVTGKLTPPNTYVDKEGRTQVGLEVTAEMMEFSPFGRTDRAEGQNASTGNYGNSQYNPVSQSANSYGAQEGSFPSSSKPALSPYGNFSTGQGNDHDINEDNLPF